MHLLSETFVAGGSCTTHAVVAKRCGEPREENSQYSIAHTVKVSESKINIKNVDTKERRNNYWWNGFLQFISCEGIQLKTYVC